MPPALFVVIIESLRWQISKNSLQQGANLLLRNFNKPRIGRIGRIVFSFNQHNPLNPRLNKLPEQSEG